MFTLYWQSGQEVSRVTAPCHRSCETLFTLTSLVAESSYELPRIDIQGFCQEDDIDQSNIALSALDRADIRAMQACTMRKRFLRQACCRPHLAHAGTEGYEKLAITRHLFNVVR